MRQVYILFAFINFLSRDTKLWGSEETVKQIKLTQSEWQQGMIQALTDLILLLSLPDIFALFALGFNQFFNIISVITAALCHKHISLLQQPIRLPEQVQAFTRPKNIFFFINFWKQATTD